ncbi:MAG: GNAT family N-acetyltransferase [Saprospiraceae bacterium]|nr:GNAT family N-acetyltransferase [Saprospiraceae bacterium]
MKDIRKVCKEDIVGLKRVLENVDLFPSEMLDEMISDYLINPESEEIWFTYTVENKPISIGYCAPQKLTERTYNLYAIGVHADSQGQGIGKAMMDFIEKYLQDIGARILIVETSSTLEFALTRAFYNKIGYTQEATIRDFWKDGDDKVVFWKKLNTL